MANQPRLLPLKADHQGEKKKLRKLPLAETKEIYLVSGTALGYVN